MSTIEKQLNPNWKFIIGIPILIYLSCFTITFTTKYIQNKIWMSNAILFDLIVTAPVLYLAAIWRTKISKISLFQIITIGFIIAGLLLDSKKLLYLRNIKFWITPLIEMMIIFYIAKFFIEENKKLKNDNSSINDFLTICRKLTANLVKNEILANIIASEIAVFYYIFYKPTRIIDNKINYSYHKRNGIIFVLYAILSILIIETVGMHFFISIYNKHIAWVLSSLGAYSCLQLFGHIRAIKSRPIILKDTFIEIHNGLAGDAIINYKNIETINLTKNLIIDKNSVKIALLKNIETHNIVIQLKSTIFVYKFFGIKKSCDFVMFFVDAPEEFISNVNKLM